MKMTLFAQAKDRLSQMNNKKRFRQSFLLREKKTYYLTFLIYIYVDIVRM